MTVKEIAARHEEKLRIAERHRGGLLYQDESDRAALLDLVARLREFLDRRSFGPHWIECASCQSEHGECDCGLDALLDESAP